MYEVVVECRIWLYYRVLWGIATLGWCFIAASELDLLFVKLGGPIGVHGHASRYVHEHLYASRWL